MFRLTGNQQTRLSLTTYFWSLWYSLKDTWLGASSSAYKQPGALHTPHAYTLAWCFGSQFGFFLLLFLFLSSIFVSQPPSCASARLVVLKGFGYKPFKNIGAEFLTFFCFLPSSLTSTPSPFPSHPGIGLHVNMEGGGHLDARWCRRVGSSLAKRISRESRGWLGTSVGAWSDTNCCWSSPPTLPL